MDGYQSRGIIESWEKEHQCGYFDDYGATMRSTLSQSDNDKFMREFNVFVCKHYGGDNPMLKWWQYVETTNISDEEAFDKFFELLDKFLEYKGITL